LSNLNELKLNEFSVEQMHQDDMLQVSCDWKEIIKIKIKTMIQLKLILSLAAH
jgi:hypothetical protein